MGDPDTSKDETSSSPSPSPTAVDAAQHVEPVKSTSSAPPSPSSLKPNKSSDSLVEVGCLFESNQATRSRHFAWTLRESNHCPSEADAAEEQEQQPQRLVRVVLHHVADNDPGALQSGHYLWPAAEMLAEYLIHVANHNHNDGNNEADALLFQKVESVLELGAGCALPTLVALQVWQRTVQCLVVTDHDATVLQRAVDNHESTLEAILNASLSDNELNAAINCVGSIPVLFEKLEWDRAAATTSDNSSSRSTTNTYNNHSQSIREQLLEHTNSQTETVDVVLGSDLIYHVSVVAPLLETAVELMHPVHGRFWLAQSFSYDNDVEQEIDTVCQRLGLVRTILLQEKEDHGKRIQEFCFSSARSTAVVQEEGAPKQEGIAVDRETKNEKEKQVSMAAGGNESKKDVDLDDENKELDTACSTER